MVRRLPVCSLVLAGFALFLLAPLAFAASWVRVESAHFTVSGNAGEQQARAVATQLEQFREVLVRLFPHAKLTVRPLFVVAFDSDKAYRPFKPQRDGKPMPVDGYFAGNSDGGCVTLQLDRADDSYPVIFHEYTHLFLEQASATRMPVWLNEGLAEYYSTVQFMDGAKRVRIGLPIRSHVMHLREQFIPVRSLITMERSAPTFADQAAGALFYAESWALVHFLSQESGGSRTVLYLQRLAAGRPSVEAFEETFGPIAQVERGLRDYVQRAIYQYLQFDFTKRVEAGELAARPLSPGEVEATLAIPLIYLDRREEASARIAAALEAVPGLPEALAARGLLELRARHSEEAERAFRAAVEKAPGNLEIAFRWAQAVASQPQSDPAALERARTVLAAATPSDSPTDVLDVLAYLDARTKHFPEAEAAYRTLLARVPGRHEFAFNLVEALVGQKKYADARAALGPLVAKPVDAAEGERARHLLQWVTSLESPRVAPDLPGAAGAEPPTEAPGRDKPADGHISPAFRDIGPGESRVSGALERIDCQPGGIVLDVKTTNGAIRFYAARFQDVDFITYRTDLTGNVACGPRAKREAVYVTSRALDAKPPAAFGPVAGRVVAVEFLPK